MSVVAICGATGMLGKAVYAEGARRGHLMVGIARKGADQSADMSSASELNATLERIAPDVVINAAAQTSLDACERDPGACYSVNARAVALLASWCTKNDRKLVQISTDHYFSGDGDRLHAEDAPVSLCNEYARSKYAGEAFAATCRSSLILRTNLVGFRHWPQQPTFTEWAIAGLTNGEAMTLFEDFYTSSIDVQRFSVAMFDLIERGAKGLLNVAARQSSNKAQFIRALAQRLNLSLDYCKPGSVRTIPGVQRAESLGLDVSRAETLLGYQLPDLAAVIEALAHEYLETRHAV